MSVLAFGQLCLRCKSEGRGIFAEVWPGSDPERFSIFFLAESVSVSVEFRGFSESSVNVTLCWPDCRLKGFYFCNFILFQDERNYN